MALFRTLAVIAALELVWVTGSLVALGGALTMPDPEHPGTPIGGYIIVTVAVIVGLATSAVVLLKDLEPMRSRRGLAQRGCLLMLLCLNLLMAALGVSAVVAGPDLASRWFYSDVLAMALVAISCSAVALLRLKGAVSGMRSHTRSSLL